MVTHQIVTAIPMVTRAPSVSLFVVCVLTASISASVAIVALVDVALLKPLPYPSPDRLVTLTYTFNSRVVPRASEAKFVVWQEVSRALDEPTAVEFRIGELDTTPVRSRLILAFIIMKGRSSVMRRLGQEPSLENAHSYQAVAA